MALSSLLVGLCLVFGASAELFMFPKEIRYYNQSMPMEQSCESPHGFWAVQGHLELTEANLLKFFVPAVDVYAKGHKVCAIDLTSCPPDIMPPKMGSCFCSKRFGNEYHLHISQPAHPDHVGAELSVGIPLRYSWFKYSKVWFYDIGMLPKLNERNDMKDNYDLKSNCLADQYTSDFINTVTGECMTYAVDHKKNMMVIKGSNWTQVRDYNKRVSHYYDPINHYWCMNETIDARSENTQCLNNQSVMISQPMDPKHGYNHQATLFHYQSGFGPVRLGMLEGPMGHNQILFYEDPEMNNTMFVYYNWKNNYVDESWFKLPSICHPVK